MRKTSFLFIISQMLGLCAENIFTLGISLIVWNKTSSATSVGFVWATIYTGSLCAFFLIPLLKKYPHKLIIQGSDFLSSISILFFFFAVSFFAAPRLISFVYLPLFFGYGVLRAVNKSYVQGFIGYLAPDKKTLTLLHTDYQMATITASAFALVLLFVFHIQKHVYFIMLFSLSGFLLCFILTFFLTALKPFTPEASPYRTQLYQSMRVVFHHPMIFALVFLCSTAFALGVSLNNQLFPLMSLYHFSFRHYIIAESFMIAALMGMGMFLRQKSHTLDKIGYTKIIIIGWSLTGICYITLPYASFSYWIFLIPLTFSAITDSISSVTQRLLLVSLSPTHMIESIFTLRIIARDIYKIIIASLLGASIQNLGGSLSFILVGALIIFVMLCTLGLSFIPTRHTP